MLPVIVQVVLVQKPLAKPKSEVGEMDLLRVVVERNASRMRHAVVLAVNGKPMKVGIAPAEADLNGVMEIGDALVTAQQEGRQIIGLIPRSTTFNWYTQTNCGRGIRVHFIPGLG